MLIIQSRYPRAKGLMDMAWYHCSQGLTASNFDETCKKAGLYELVILGTFYRFNGVAVFD